MTFKTAIQVAVEVRQMPCGHFVAATPDRWQIYDEGNAEDMRWVKCSEGDSWGRVETELMKARKELVQERQRREVAQAEAIKASLDAKAARKDLDGALTELGRTHRRLQAGVCPYCHRTFHQVQRHMTRKHPGRPGVVK